MKKIGLLVVLIVLTTMAAEGEAWDWYHSSNSTLDAWRRAGYQNGYEAGYADGYAGYSACPRYNSPEYRDGYNRGYQDGAYDGAYAYRRGCNWSIAFHGKYGGFRGSGRK